MHFTDLELEAFGPFSDYALTGLRPGLVVLHGPNEAGKSTVRHFVRWLLFGSQRGEAKRWLDRRGHLGGSARLVADGAPLVLAREARDVVLRSDAGPPVRGEGAVRDLLGRGGALDRALYDAVFTFDLFDLQRLEALGDAHVQHLLAVGAVLGGGAHPADALRALEAEGKAIWTPRGRTTRLHEARRAVREASAALAAARDQAEAHGRLRAELEAQDGRLSALRGAAAEARVVAEERARRRDAWPLWVARVERLAAVDALTAPGEAPLQPETRERLAALRDALSQAAVEDAEASRRLGAAREARAEIAVDEALLAEAEAIEALAHRLAAVEAHEAERDREREELAAAEAAADEALGLLGRGLDEAQLAALDPTAEAEAEARRHQRVLAPLEVQLPAERAAADAAAERAHAALSRIDGALAALGPSPLEGALARAEALLAEAPSRLADAEALGAEEAEAAGLAATEEADREAIGGWPALAEADVEELRGLAQAWRDVQVQHEQRLAAAQARHEQAGAAVVATQHELGRVEAALAPPAPGASEVAELKALWPRAREAFAEVRECDAQLARGAAQERALGERLGLAAGAGLRPVEGVELAVAALARVEQAQRAEDDALERRGRAEAALAALPRPDRGEDLAALARRAEVARDKRAAVLDARAALDDLQRGGTAPPRARGWAPWLPVLLLLLVAAVALAFAAVVAVTALVAAAVAAAVVEHGRRRAAREAAAPDEAEARRRFALAVAAAGLGEGAGRGELDRALEGLREGLEEVARAHERAQQAAAARDRALEAQQALAAAADDVARAVGERRAALAAARLPVDGSRLVWAAWVDAARELRELRGRLEAPQRRRDEAAERLAAFVRALSVWVPVPRSEGARGAAAEARAEAQGPWAAEGVRLAWTPAAVEAAWERLSALRAQAEGREAAAREARAALDAATREVGAARAELEAAAAAAGVPAALREGWRAWAARWRVGAEAPSGELVAAARRAAAAWARAQRRAGLAAVLGGRRARVGAFEAELGALEALAGLGGEARVAARVAALRAAVDAARERRAARSGQEEERGRRAEEQRAARAAQDAAGRREAERDAARADFERWRVRLGAPAGLGAEDAVAWVERVRRAQGRVAARVAAAGRVARSEGAAAAWEGEVHAVAERLGVGLGAEAAGAAGAWVRARRRGLDEARAAQAQAAERAERVAAHEAEARAAAAARGEREGAWKEALAAVGCADEVAWEARVARERARELVVGELGAVEAELRGGLGAAWADVGAWGLARDAAEWGGVAAEAAARAEDLGREVEEVERARAELRERARGLEMSAAVVEHEHVLAEAERERDAAQRMWWQLTIARHLLGDTFECFRREQQPVVLRQASVWLGVVTEGAYVAVEADDEAAALRFVVRDAAGRLHPAEGLSTGTVAAVYLCLRLALALHEAERTGPVPVLMDDVLAHFDPARAVGVARLLGAVAAAAPALQLLLFTCRPEVVEVIGAEVPGAAVIAMARWAGASGPAPRAGGAGRASARAAG